MATDITFGIKTDPVATTKVDSGALGNTANSTSSGASSTTLSKDGKQTLQDQLAIAANDKANGVSLSSGTQSTVTQPVTAAADTNQLESSTSSNVSLPNPTEPQKIDVSSALDKITTQAGAIQNTLDQNKEQYDLQATQDKASKYLNKAFDSLSSLGKFESGVADSVELQKKKELKTEIDNKIMRKSRDFDLALRAAEDTFGTRAQKNATKAEITKNYNRELADLSIIQMARAGEYNDARAFVDEKVRLELQDRQNNLNKLMFFYQENKERLSLLDQRAFQAKIVQDERAYQEEYATRKRLEDIKATMTINAAEDGAGNASLQAIQGANSLTELMALPNSGRWSKSKADRLAEQLQQVNLSRASVDLARASTELSILRNPPANAGLSAATVKAMQGLNSTQQENLTQANATVRDLNRLKEMVSQYSPVQLENKATPIGQEFNRVASNIVDLMARDRTGATVTTSEEKAFKKILGLGFFSRSISGKDDVLNTLDNQIQKHTETLTLIDPTGDIRGALGTLTTQVDPNDYLNSVDEALRGNVYSVYQ